MLMSFVAAMAVLFAADPPPVNPDADKPTVAGPAAKKADDDKLVCREEGRANSRFKQQVCLTKKEWRDRGRTGEEMARELGNRPNVNLVPGS